MNGNGHSESIYNIEEELEGVEDRSAQDYVDAVNLAVDMPSSL